MRSLLFDPATALALTQSEFLIVIAAVFTAGLVRGFAGFGLSAVMMASVAVIIPPVQLIPVTYVLEAAATVLMVRGGMKHADMKIVWGFVIGGAVGTPIGLYATVALDAGLSKRIALLLIMVLAGAQLLRLKPAFLATKPGLYLSGLTAGIANGLASVGGMVVALYVLASGVEPKVMRASLVMFLCLSMFTSAFYLAGYGLITPMALWRAAVFTPVVLAGVAVGTLFFRPASVPYYKSFCLVLLLVLCTVGLAKLWGS